MSEKRNYVISLDVNFDGDKYALVFNNEEILGSLKLTSEYSMQDFIDLVLNKFPIYPDCKIVYDKISAGMYLSDMLAAYTQYKIKESAIRELSFSDVKNAMTCFPGVADVLKRFLKNSSSLDVKIEISKLADDSNNIELVQTVRGVTTLRQKDINIPRVRLNALLNGLYVLNSDLENLPNGFAKRVKTVEGERFIPKDDIKEEFNDKNNNK